MKTSINPRYKKEILRALEYHFPGAKIMLFGSRARRTHKEGADIDIAIDAGKAIPSYELARARVTMEHLHIGPRVDLVDMQVIPQILKDTILEEGIVWKS